MLNIVVHREKAEKIERTISRIDSSHYETVIEGAMLAGTNWFNISLHALKLTPEDDDALHAEFISLGQRRKITAVAPQLLRAMDEIELLRILHVRGDFSGGELAAGRALDCLAVLRAEAARYTGNGP